VRFQRRWLAAAVSTAVVAISAVALTSSGVSAAGSIDPSITGDPNAANGSILFFDAAGNRITSGPLAAPFTGYAVASSATTKTGTNRATLFVATPDHTKTDSTLWFNQTLAGPSIWPLSGAPAAVTAAETAGVPAVAVKAGDGNLAGAFVGAVNDPTTGFDHIMQIRMEDSGPGNPVLPPFWATDVYIDTTAGTWTQVYPAVQTQTVTSVSAITATPASPAPHGTTVSLSATVSAADSSHPAGAVHLFDGASDLGAATFNAATGAVSATDTPADGAHSYTFKFTPTDTTTYAGATSAALAYTVNAATATTTTLAASPASPSTVGDSVTLTATVSVPAAAGTVQFKDGSSNLGSPITVSGGVGTTSTTGLAVGSHSLTAVFTPTSNTYTGSTSNTVAYTVNPAPATPTTTSLAVTPASPVDFGTTVTMTATVSPSNAAGTVRFYDGATALGSAVAVSGGTASMMTSALASGAHSLSAKFTPTDPATFGASNSSASSLSVSAQTTTTTLTAPAGPVDHGTAVTLTATLAPSGAAGTVQFKDGSGNLGSPVTVSGGKATLTTSTLTVASHTLTAEFTPTDASQFTASTSAPVTLVVQNPPPGQTTTGLAVTPAGPVTVGDTVTLRATVTPAAAGGTVSFTDGGTAIGSAVTVVNGIASTTVTPTLGSHSYQASFTSSDPVSYADSQSGPVTLQVNPPATKTATTLAVSPAGPVDYGTAVTFTATVGPLTAGDPAPSGGSVRFDEGGTVLGTETLAGTTASLMTSALSGGAHSVTATYLPSDPAAFATSTSAPATITVNAQPSTTGLSVSPAGKATVGKTVTLTAAVAPAGATGSVEFFDGSTSLGTSAVSGGAASLATTKLALGDHSLTAVFAPADAAVFGGSTSTAVPLTVVAAPELGSVSDGSGKPITAGSTLQPGQQLTLTASGFQPGETVSVILASTPTTLATTTADSTGKVSVTVTLPSNLSAGAHTLTLHGTLADVVFAFKIAAASASATPTPTSTEAGSSGSGGGLASTGAVLWPALGFGIVLLLAGAGLLLGTRRRRAH